MISAFVGVAIVALPSGIMTAGYLDELKARRDQKEAKKNLKKQNQTEAYEVD
jgi:voltage-gated potassium channel